MKFLKENWIKLFVFIVISAIIFLIIRQRRFANNPATTYIPDKDTSFSPKVQDIKDVINLAGTIRATNIAVLSFPSGGKMNWIGVKLGDRVRKYQTIATLDRSQLQKQLQTDFNLYQNQLSQFQDTQDKYKELKDKYLLTDNDKRLLDRAQWNLENSVVQYEIQDLIIRNSSIVSPISGVVIAIDQPVAGTNITPSAATFTIVDPNSVYFRSEINQESVNQIKPGQVATINLDSKPNASIDSKINFISFAPVAGQSSTVYEVRFDLPVQNDDLSYRLGMDGDVSILIKEKSQVLTVPTDAIYSDNDQNYVWVKNANNSLTRQDITIGIETDTDSEVLSGLTGNETLVIKKI